jgi:hypothetical protein
VFQAGLKAPIIAIVVQLSPYLSHFANKEIGIVLTEIRNPNFYVYLYDFVMKTIATGSKVTIFDATNSNKITNYLPLRGQLNEKRNRRKIVKYSSIFKNHLPKEVNLVSLEMGPNVRVAKILPKNLKEFRESNVHPEELKRSVQSMLVTHIRKTATKTNLSNKDKKNVATMVLAFYETYNLLKSAKELKELDVILSLNGRKSDQAAVTYFCRTTKKKQFFFENGSVPGFRYYISPAQPQDVVKFQTWYESKILKARSREEKFSSRRRAIEWFESRESQPPDFGQGPAIQDYNLEDLGSGLTIGLFLSSIGEMDYVDGDIKVQFETWYKLLSKISENPDVGILIRFHPNLLNYAWSDLIALNRFFHSATRELGVSRVKYIQPWANISSYKILEVIDGLITWNSTIGLEAAYRGIPMGVLTDTFYSKILGAVPLFSDGDKNLNDLLKKFPKDKCLDACSVQFENGEFVSQDVIDSTFYKRIIHEFGIGRQNQKSIQRFQSKQLLKLVTITRVTRSPMHTKRFLSKLTSNNKVLELLELLVRLHLRIRP